MFSPQEQQIEICLLKSNLEEIENNIVLQRSALPALDAENEQKYRETMTALRTVRALNAEIERLKMDNVRLTAKRMQLRRQSESVNKSLEIARRNRKELNSLLKEEERETEIQIRQYEDSLQEKADRFRKTRGFYNEEEVTKDTDKINELIVELQGELSKQNDLVEELKQQLEEMQPDVPADLLNIMGNAELDEKVKEVTKIFEALLEKRENHLRHKIEKTTPFKIF